MPKKDGDVFGGVLIKDIMDYRSIPHQLKAVFVTQSGALRIVDEASSTLSNTTPVIEARGQYSLMPGLLDSHVHGQGGFDFADVGEHPESIAEITRALANTGLSYVMPTLVSLDLPTLEKSLNAIEQYIKQQSLTPTPGATQIVGVHLEGPFISKACKGAHAESAIQGSITLALFKQIISAAPSVTEWKITLAPDLPGAAQFISEVKSLEAEGIFVKVFLGHSNPSNKKDIESAIEAGAAGFIHLGNACGETCSRMEHVCEKDTKSNLVQWVLEHPESCPAGVEIIADGMHLSRSFVQLLHEKVGDKLVLVTDALGPTGKENGLYKLGSLPIIKKDQGFYLATAQGEFLTKETTRSDGTKETTPILAGSASSLVDCAAHYAEFISDSTLSKQQQMLSVYNALIRNARKSSLSAKAIADLPDETNFVILNQSAGLVLSLCQGQIQIYDNDLLKPQTHISTEANSAEDLEKMMPVPASSCREDERVSIPILQEALKGQQSIPEYSNGVLDLSNLNYLLEASEEEFRHFLEFLANEEVSTPIKEVVVNLNNDKQGRFLQIIAKCTSLTNIKIISLDYELWRPEKPSVLMFMLKILENSNLHTLELARCEVNSHMDQHVPKMAKKLASHFKTIIISDLVINTEYGGLQFISFIQAYGKTKIEHLILKNITFSLDEEPDETKEKEFLVLLQTEMDILKRSCATLQRLSVENVRCEGAALTDQSYQAPTELEFPEEEAVKLLEYTQYDYDWCIKKIQECAQLIQKKIGEQQSRSSQEDSYEEAYNECEQKAEEFIARFKACEERVKHSLFSQAYSSQRSGLQRELNQLRILKQKYEQFLSTNQTPLTVYLTKYDVAYTNAVERAQRNLAQREITLVLPCDGEAISATNEWLKKADVILLDMDLPRVPSPGSSTHKSGFFAAQAIGVTTTSNALIIGYTRNGEQKQSEQGISAAIEQSGGAVFNSFSAAVENIRPLWVKKQLENTLELEGATGP